ncbi:MAG TPA: phosphate ABC transporter permease PstA [Anaerolineaceae bacterium]|nr:phosphate ABC transporter permease PstA [Anaerolineaceae bacterium]HOV07021.1 phosphate ABC transporter permease PstA [Anaerolineaceae bacterium]
MKPWRFKKRHIAETIARFFMLLSFLIVAASLISILWTVLARGLPALSWQMISQTPKGGYYLGKEGGILNAIVGSLLLALGGTVLALIFSLPLALFLETYVMKTRWAKFVRLTLDILWGIPSIVYGAFGFTLMLAIGLRASLLGGIIVLALLEIPIMTRAMDEVIRLMPAELSEASLALGASKLETAVKITLRQMLPGITTATLLAFGRGIGDAASVLFTAGYTDRIPTSLLSPTASLPLAIYFQLGTPYPEVQQRAYASALILTVVVLVISLGSRFLAARLSKYINK